MGERKTMEEQYDVLSTEETEEDRVKRQGGEVLKKHLQLLGSTGLLGLGGQQRGVDVGKDTTLGDGDVTEKLVQLLIVADSELQVTGDDTGLLVVAGGVTSQLENFSSQVLEDGSEVDGGTSTNALGVVAATEQTVNTANGELKTGLGRAGLGLGASSRLSTRFTTRHC